MPETKLPNKQLLPNKYENCTFPSKVVQQAGTKFVQCSSAAVASLSADLFQPPLTEVFQLPSTPVSVPPLIKYIENPVESADAYFADFVTDQSALPDISLSSADLQGSFLFTELSPVSVERNPTSTPDPIASKDAVESLPVLHSSDALETVQVHSQIQQTEHLGTFLIWLQAADLLWNDPNCALQSSSENLCEQTSHNRMVAEAAESQVPHRNKLQSTVLTSAIRFQSPSNPDGLEQSNSLAPLNDSVISDTSVLLQCHQSSRRQ